MYEYVCPRFSQNEWKIQWIFQKPLRFSWERTNIRTQASIVKDFIQSMSNRNHTLELYKLWCDSKLGINPTAFLYVCFKFDAKNSKNIFRFDSFAGLWSSIHTVWISRLTPRFYVLWFVVNGIWARCRRIVIVLNSSLKRAHSKIIL